MALPVTFSSNLPRDFERIRGAATLHVGAYQNAGAVTPDPYYLGQVADGGFGVNVVRNYVDVEGEEEFEAASDILVKEGTTIKCTLQQVPIDTLALVIGSGMNFTTTATLASMTGDDVAPITGSTPNRTELGYGGMRSALGGGGQVNYYQVLLRAWNENPSGAFQGVGANGPQYWQPVSSQGYWQFFQCLIVPAGEMKVEKKGICSIPIEIKARWDWSVVPLVDITTSRGRIWRRVIVTA